MEWVADLFSQTDERSHFDPARGINRYGAPFQPSAEWLDFGSCTSCIPSVFSFEKTKKFFAEELLPLKLQPEEIQLGKSQEFFSNFHPTILRTLCFLDRETPPDLIFTASGTDAEWISLSLTHQVFPGNRIFNLLVGGNELGRGTETAAAGRVFCENLPLGFRGNLSAAEKTRVTNLSLRDPQNGTPIPLEELDRLVLKQVEHALTNGEIVLLHCVITSKTGLSAPSFELLQTLKHRHTDKVWIVVDLAQGRFHPEMMQKVWSLDPFVSFTGSKFFGGPSFCGVVAIPKTFSQQLKNSNKQPLDPALGQFVAASGFPASWNSLALPVFGPSTHSGLLLRWHSAIQELERWNAHSWEEHTRVFESFNHLLRERANRIPRLNFLNTMGNVISGPQTLFPFFIQGMETTESLRAFQENLVSEAPRIRLGQPVILTPNKSVLRIAWSAHTVERDITPLFDKIEKVLNA